MASENQRQSDLGRALASGVDLQRAGRHADAEQHYRRLLRLWPGDADGLQLLGVALKAQGKFADAEGCIRQSLAAKHGQPHAWANLGNLLAEMRRGTEAVAAYREALKVDQRTLAAWLGLAAVLLSRGEHDAAAQAYDRANDLDPRNASAAIGRATLASRNFDHERAEQLLRQAIASEPRNAAAHYNLGMTLAVLGDGRRARPLIEHALALQPGRADMLAGFAYALQIDGETTLAIQRYRDAIAANPLHLAAHENLARLLWQMGLPSQYLSELERTIARLPNHAALHISRANLLGLARRYGEAREAFACADALNPGDPVVLDGLARTAAELGDVRQCLDDHRRAVSLASGNAGISVSQGHSLLRFGHAKDATTVFEGVLAAHPDDQLALADLTLAYRAAGDPRADWLADESLAASIELRPPRGYKDMAVFNRDLDQALDDVHQARTEPLDQSLRNGTQTLGTLFGRGIDLVARLRESIDDAVRDHIRALLCDAAHPFLRRKSRGFRYSGSWSSRLRTSGHHVPHIHPQGWISSAYYVALPAAVKDAATKEGWFALGAPPFDFGWREPVRRYIRPREGMLLLFPSYFYHATTPFSGSQSRTTIAFDVVPSA